MIWYVEVCGIFGAISRCSSVTDLLLCGLDKLEYRGYDSCGVALLGKDGSIESHKSEGQIIELRKIVECFRDEFICSKVGIAHTRWATHGIPGVKNAHPVHVGKVAVVHNGVIENYLELRRELEMQGVVFKTDTDTEVIPQIVNSYLNSGCSPIEAVSWCLKRLLGSFAVIFLFSEHHDLLIASKKRSPLVFGYGEDSVLLASDSSALQQFASKVFYLEDDDIVVINHNVVDIYNCGVIVNRSIGFGDFLKEDLSLGDYQCFMDKEINEQPHAVERSIEQFIDCRGEIVIPGLSSVEFITNITIVACGSSYFSGLIAKYWLESIAAIRVHIEIASEFRYSNVKLSPGEVVLFISQSGETADTLEALHYAKAHKQFIITLTNVPGSSMERFADLQLRILAGHEIGVASTKTFVTQLAVLACFSLFFARFKISHHILSDLTVALKSLAQIISNALEKVDVSSAVMAVDKYNSAMIIGRGAAYGVAMEGALKIRELAYINTLGVAAGEMKHGSIALVDNCMPVIAIAPYNKSLFFKTVLNIQEVIARQGLMFAITDHRGIAALPPNCHNIIEMPEVNDFIAPILYCIPMQLIAYQLALRRNLNPDRPRNLAKSVTVE